MLCEPLPHLLTRPCPLKGVGVSMVVFRPRSQDMRLEFLPTLPGRPFQVIVFKRMDEDFCLVQPRGIGGCIAWLPPSLTSGEVRLGVSRYVTGTAILDQEYALQLLVLLVKQFQFGKVVLVVVLRQEYQLHQPGMHYQEHQHVHGPMSGVVELLLLDRPWDRSADWVTLQDLEGRDFIDAHDPDALLGKSIRIPIAPKDLLRPLREPGIEASRLPVAGAMGLQIDVLQNAANRCRADRRDDLVIHCLAGQVFAGPVRDVQPLGDRLQTGEFNDLGPLHGGNLLRATRIALPAVGEQTRQATLAITFAGPPNRGFVTFEPGGNRTLPFPSSDGQHNLGTLYLEPGQGTALGGGM